MQQGPEGGGPGSSPLRPRTHQDWQFLSDGTVSPGRYDLPWTRQGGGGGGVGHTATHCIWSSSKMGASGGHLG